MYNFLKILLLVLREERAVPEDVPVRGVDPAGLQTGAGEGTPLRLLRAAHRRRGGAPRRRHRPDCGRLVPGHISRDDLIKFLCRELYDSCINIVYLS